MDACQSVDPSREKMTSSQAFFAMVDRAPIDLPEQVLIMIVSRVRDARPATPDLLFGLPKATAEADARSLCADVMRSGPCPDSGDA